MTEQCCFRTAEIGLFHCQHMRIIVTQIGVRKKIKLRIDDKSADYKKGSKRKLNNDKRFLQIVFSWQHKSAIQRIYRF